MHMHIYLLSIHFMHQLAILRPDKKATVQYDLKPASRCYYEAGENSHRYRRPSTYC
jgi:hypothetical protein